MILWRRPSVAMPRRSTPTSPPIRRAPCQQIAVTCWRFATSSARSRTAAGTATRRNPIAGPGHQRGRLSSCCGATHAARQRGTNSPYLRGCASKTFAPKAAHFASGSTTTYVVTTGDEVFRVIADCSFGPPGLSEVEIASGFDKLAGRAPLEVVGPAEPDALLGTALPLVIDDPELGWFWFGPRRPARYTQTNEDGPTYELFADLSGRFDTALARAREIVPGIEAQVAQGALLVQVTRPDFGKSEAPRLLGADFRHDGSVHISIDDGIEGSVSADLELGTDGNLCLIEIDDN